MLHHFPSSLHRGVAISDAGDPGPGWADDPEEPAMWDTVSTPAILASNQEPDIEGLDDPEPRLWEIFCCSNLLQSHFAFPDL